MAHDNGYTELTRPPRDRSHELDFGGESTPETVHSQCQVQFGKRANFVSVETSMDKKLCQWLDDGHEDIGWEFRNPENHGAFYYSHPNPNHAFPLSASLVIQLRSGSGAQVAAWTSRRGRM